MLKRFAVISSIFLLLSGCTTRLIDFTIISSKNFDLANSENFKKDTGRVIAKDSSYIIIIFSTGTPNVKEAVDKAIEQVPGAVALVDGVISRYSFYIPCVYGHAAWIVEGNPLIDTSLADIRDFKGKYIISFLNPKSNKYETIRTDKSQYTNIKNLMKNGNGEAVYKALMDFQNT